MLDLLNLDFHITLLLIHFKSYLLFTHIYQRYEIDTISNVQSKKSSVIKAWFTPPKQETKGRSYKKKYNKIQFLNCS